MSKMRPNDWQMMHYFSAQEFVEPEKMSRRLVAMLDLARHGAGIPFHITSSFRDGDDLSHGDGHGVDIACVSSSDRYAIVNSLLIVGFSRIGIYPRHIHADISRRLPQGVLFLGGYDGS